MLHYLRLFFLILTFFLIGQNHSAIKKRPTLRTQPRYVKPNIDLMKQNPSIQRYLKDSINYIPFNQPRIYIQLEPLHPHLLGITYKLAHNTYLIGLNPLYSHPILQRTLHHELVHVKQLDRGIINGNLWKGKPQDWSLPWALRPWEVEAERETRLLYKP